MRLTWLVGRDIRFCWLAQRLVDMLVNSILPTLAIGVLGKYVYQTCLMLLSQLNNINVVALLAQNSDRRLRLDDLCVWRCLTQRLLLSGELKLDVGCGMLVLAALVMSIYW